MITNQSNRMHGSMQQLITQLISAVLRPENNETNKQEYYCTSWWDNRSLLLQQLDISLISST